MKWSKYQLAIFDDVAKGEGHTVVEALAGSGKTSSIIEALKYIPTNLSWLLVAFNKRIADELKLRAPAGGEVSTLHSLGLKSIGKTFRKISVDNSKTENILIQLLGSKDETKELRYQLAQAVSLAKGYLAHTAIEIDEILDSHDIEPLEIERDEFINHILFVLDIAKKKTSIVDFDDMIWFPNVLKLDIPKFDRVFVDEAQDLNKAQIEFVLQTVRGKAKTKRSKAPGRITAIGDPNQCINVNTIVQTPLGFIKASEIKINDLILSYKNGETTYSSVKNIVQSKWTYGFEITTERGKTLLMSPNHKIWANGFDTLGKQFLVYLMYRNDMGFRVGKTNKWKSNSNPFGARTNSEYADKLWILDIASSNEEAILLEEIYSLKYGIPTAVFNGAQRGLNQNRIDEIFKLFGENGNKLLKDKFLSFDYPHWASRTNILTNRLRINLLAHSKNNHSNVFLEWSDEKTSQLFLENNIPFLKSKKGYRIRRYFAKYIDARTFAENIANITGSFIDERLSFNDACPRLLTASGLFVGMKVISLNNGKCIEDKIISIKKCNGDFIDLEIDDTANFFGNGILSHNSIYQWRGADSDAIGRIRKTLNAKTLGLPVTYRCPLTVVKEAQKIVPALEPAPNAIDGKIDYISYDEMYKLARPGCFILSRVNAPLVTLALGFIKRGIPANIQGRDIGENLVQLINRSKAKTIESFVDYVERWKKKECQRLMARNRDTTLVIDKAECLFALAEGADSVRELKSNIERLFSDTDDSKKVILSTTHKAKGLERDTVFMLTNTFRYSGGEESNIRYVAITRAKKELYFVKSKLDKE